MYQLDEKQLDYLARTVMPAIYRRKAIKMANQELRDCRSETEIIPEDRRNKSEIQQQSPQLS